MAAFYTLQKETKFLSQEKSELVIYSHLFKMTSFYWSVIRSFRKDLEIIHVCAKSLQSCLTLFNPMDYSPPHASVRGILQVRILEWVAMTSPRESSQPRDQTSISYVSCIGRQVLYRQCHLGSPTLLIQYHKLTGHYHKLWRQMSTER